MVMVCSEAGEARFEKRHQPTIAWPSDAEFARMTAEMSNVKIAEKLSCTEAAVRKERKKRKI